MISSKEFILVGQRQFRNVRDLWSSTFLNKYEAELLGVKQLIWFEKLPVMFPDKQHHSASFVEVHNRTVTVGYPNYYLTWQFGTVGQALKFAEGINERWLKFSGSAKEFLRQLNP